MSSSTTKHCENLPLAPLLASAVTAWSDWQSRLRDAAEDPEQARLFAQEAATLWLDVERAAASLGFALVTDPSIAEAEFGAMEAPVAEPDEPSDSPVSAPTTAAPPETESMHVEPATLQLLEDRMNGHRFDAKVHGSESALGLLRKAVGRTPMRRMDRMLFRGQLKTLPAAVDGRLLAALSEDERYLALTWLAARVRCLQEFAKSDPTAPTAPLSGLFTRLVRSLALGVSHHVHGLARQHQPKADTWLQDALDVEADIDHRLGRTRPGSQSGKEPAARHVDDGFRRLRTTASDGESAALLKLVDELLALGVTASDVRWVGPLEARIEDVAGTLDRERVQRAVRRASADAKSPKSKAPTWHRSMLTRGKRAVILGGDGRRDRVDKLTVHFEFAVLDWPDLPQGSPRALKSIVAQLKAGKYDIAIVLQQFISHAVTDQVFRLKVDGVTVVCAKGYGVRQLEQGLERFLADDENAGVCARKAG